MFRDVLGNGSSGKEDSEAATVSLKGDTFFGGTKIASGIKVCRLYLKLCKKCGIKLFEWPDFYRNRRIKCTVMQMQRLFNSFTYIQK